MADQPATAAPLCGDPTCENPTCQPAALAAWHERQRRDVQEVVHEMLGLPLGDWPW